MIDSIIPPARIRQEDQTFVNGIARCYATANWTQEELVSVTADALRVIRQIATRYSDPSCVELNQLELESEMRKKFIQRLQEGVLDKILDRSGLFKHLATCWMNLVRATVGKCRFTAKRMGRATPPRGSKFDKYNKSFKPEMSMEAAFEDEYMNPAIQRAASVEDSKVLSDFDTDMQVLLSDTEFMVYRQLTRPNSVALTLSEMDAARGHRTKRVLSVDITPANLAMGIGLPLPIFETIVSQIRAKTKSYMSPNPPEQSYNTAVVALEKFFDVHVPRSTEPLVVRRVFTMKARADYQRVTPEIADLLTSVGARPPIIDKSAVLNCYGILWQSNHPICRACDLYDACRVEAANFGLEGIALSPKILPPRGQARTATRDGAAFIVPGELSDVDGAEAVKSVKPDPTSMATNSEEAHLLAFLEENFYGFYIFGERYYSYASSRGQQVGQVYLFRACQKKDQMRIRFCTPAERLKGSLELMNGIHYLPYDLTFKESVKLLERHAEEMLGRKPGEDQRSPKAKKTKTSKSENLTVADHSKFLDENFHGFLLRGERFYCPKKKVGKGMKYLFWVGLVDGVNRVRLCKPSDDLIMTWVLDMVEGHYLVPTNISTPEAEDLMLRHAGLGRRSGVCQMIFQAIKSIRFKF